MRPEIGKRYQLRSGDIVLITGRREALMLNGKDTEWVWYGRFQPEGTLIAFNLNGTYRASSGLKPYKYDIEKIA